MILLSRLLRARWNVLRLVVAAFLLWAVAIDTPARLARSALARLPDFDYAAEASYLRAAGRYGEAIMVADEGLRDLAGPKREALLAQRDAIAAEQSSWVRKAESVGLGAISGRGDSLESLLGAVAADMLVVGDVRDLLVQGARYVVDGEADPLIVALSGVGLATTLAPEVDWVPSVLKVARKTGSMSRRMGEEILLSLKRGGKASEDALGSMMKDVASISRRASPAGAARVLRRADSASELASLARFVERQPSGAFALHVLGDEGAQLVKSGAKNEIKTEIKLAARSGEHAAEAGLASERAMLQAARKGPAGAAWLRTAGRAALRPHPLLGLAKGLYKGNIERLAARVTQELDPRAWWVLPLLAAWTFLEGAMLIARLRASPAVPHL
jgi:hypothetical protein